MSDSYQAEPESHPFEAQPIQPIQPILSVQPVQAIQPTQPTQPLQSTDPGAGGEFPTRVTAPTRISGTWVGIIVGAFVLVLLLVFILQNTQSVRVSFFTAKGHIPLGVAMVFAAIGGVMLAAIAASLRILQIRHRVAVSPALLTDTAVPVPAMAIVAVDAVPYPDPLVVGAPGSNAVDVVGSVGADATP